MRHVALVAILGLLLGTGWATVAIVRGAEVGQSSDPASAPAAPVKPVAETPTVGGPTHGVGISVTPTSATSKTSDVTPPAPLPDFEIPPIPEVSKDPYKAGPGPVRKAPADVLEEGKRLFNREGMLVMDPLGRSMFAFNSGDKPMYLLENSWREYIENVTEQGAKRVRWRVSGVVTVYGGRNYLLLTKLVHVLPEEEKR